MDEKLEQAIEQARIEKLATKLATRDAEQALVPSSPYPSAPMYPQNTAIEMNAPPPNYQQATTNHFQAG